MRGPSCEGHAKSTMQPSAKSAKRAVRMKGQLPHAAAKRKGRLVQSVEGLGKAEPTERVQAHDEARRLQLVGQRPSNRKRGVQPPAKPAQMTLGPGGCLHEALASQLASQPLPGDTIFGIPFPLPFYADAHSPYVSPYPMVVAEAPAPPLWPLSVAVPNSMDMGAHASLPVPRATYPAWLDPGSSFFDPDLSAGPIFCFKQTVASPIYEQGGAIACTSAVQLDRKNDAHGLDTNGPMAKPFYQGLARMPSAPLQLAVCRMLWTVDARKLQGNDKLAVSPPFELLCNVSKRLQVRALFKLMLYAKSEVAGSNVSLAKSSKGAESFKRTKGCGCIQLKCEAERGFRSELHVRFRLSLGTGVDAACDPVLHDFARRPICGLPRGQDVWKFGSVVDPNSVTFCIFLEQVSLV